MAGVEGLEPATSGFGDRRSDQLSYTPSAPPNASSGLGLQEAVCGKGRSGCGVAALPRRKTVSPPQNGDAGPRRDEDRRGRAGRNRTPPRIGLQSLMAATTPAPTVRPPSRMAKRSFSSMATGTISTTSMVTLSPGITISVPSGSVTIPVTSVVRK